MLISLIGFAVALTMSLLGVPLGVTLIIVGTIGFAVARAALLGQPLFTITDAGMSVDWTQFTAAFVMAGQQIFDASTNYGLTVIPLFVLMGAFIHRSDLSGELYDAANGFLGHRRDGLAMATIVACGGFAAVCGSSLAVAGTMSRVAHPSMSRYRYADSLSAGSIAAGGTLGILIPPSVPMVIFGLLSGADIGTLFIAGVVPGLLLAGLFLFTVWILVRRNEKLGPPGARVPMGERFRLLLRVWGVLVLFFVIIGGIYTGVFTPTEAAGVGAATAFLIGIFRKKLNLRTTFESLIETGITTGLIFTVLFGALIFSNFITLAGLTVALSDLIQSIGAAPLLVILAICVIYLVMGCIFDSLAMLVLTVPLFAAILVPMGVDLIWFGIIVIIVVELGLITPPIGMNVFVVGASIPNVSIWTVFRGVWPFIIAMVVTLALIIAFPPLATWLPSFM